MKVVTEKISPRKAKGWLGGSPNGDHPLNRVIRPSYVRRLAGAMSRGEWKLNGETFKIDSKGRLRDGYHRASAVVLSDCTIPSLVVYGVNDQETETIDIGAKRTVNDLLKFRGAVNTAGLAAELRYVWSYLERQTFQAVTPMPTPQQLLSLWEEDKEGYHYALNRSRAAYRETRLPQAAAAALFYLFAQANAQDAEEFFGGLAAGEGLDAGSPILVLRKALQRDFMLKGRTAASYIRAGWTVKAWNAWCEDRTITNVYYRPGGKTKESFPMVAGL